MNHHQQPHHIDELDALHPAGDRLEEGTGQRKVNAFGRPIDETETEDQIRARILARINGSHRTTNAFGRSLREAAHRTRNAFGRLLDDDKEN